MSYHAGFVGLIGQPNAGKSTLLNMFVQEKVSIVTDKPQTTRRRVLGVVSEDAGQVVFVDAPGVLKAKTGLNHFLQQEALDVIENSDALIAVLSLDEKTPEALITILEMVKESRKPSIVVITKTDLVDKAHRLVKIHEMAEKLLPEAKRFELSSKWGADLKPLRKEIISALISMLPESQQPLYDIELFTPHTMRELVAELVREQCFEELHSEIPYSLAVRLLKYDESRPNLPQIYAEIVVARESHKPILVGKSGATIKKIGEKSRQKIEKIVGGQVYLNLNVVVREDWANNVGVMKDLGYVVERKK